MDFSTQSSLLAAIVSLALGVSMLLRAERGKARTHFAVFCLSLAAWYLGAFLLALDSHEIWLRITIAVGAAIPATALAFFLEFLGVSRRSTRRGRTIALWGALGGFVVAATPLTRSQSARTVVAVWIFGALAVSLSLLYRRMRSTPSKVERARLAYLFGGGAIALLFTLADRLPHLGVAFPSLGPIAVVLFLYFLAQTLQMVRLLDLQELLGKFATTSVLATILGAIYIGLVSWASDSAGVFVFNSLLASFVILSLAEPLRAKVEEVVVATLFRERYELLRTLDSLKARLASVIDPLELARLVLDTVHESRRITHASLYLLTDVRPGFSLVEFRGPSPAAFLDASAARGLLAATRGGQRAILLENLDRRLLELRRARARISNSAPSEEVARLVEEQQRLNDIRSALTAMKAGISIPLLGAERVIGFLNLWDERVSEAYSSDEIALLLEIAEQAATVVENSKLYDRMKERDRLAALGEMAAGLAHEIRNPLGAIKAAAQFLDPSKLEGEEGEFVEVIIAEVDRLNGVVTQFLDYARPVKSTPTPTDVNDVLERTLKLIHHMVPEKVELDLRLAPSLPRAQSDAEQLKQVVINLVQNAVQAVVDGGRVTISTGRAGDDAGFRIRGRGADFVEIRVRDDGAGIPEEQREHIFVPFFTTKQKGTGLGLAISQRIVRSHGGSISLASRPGEGTEFLIRLPAVVEEKREATPLPEPSAQPKRRRQRRRRSA